jgi:hypothetical protein
MGAMGKALSCAVLATNPASADADHDNGAGVPRTPRPGGLYRDEAQRLIRARREERSAFFHGLYAMLKLKVICQKDRSLEVT